ELGTQLEVEPELEVEVGEPFGGLVVAGLGEVEHVEADAQAEPGLQGAVRHQVVGALEAVADQAARAAAAAGAFTRGADAVLEERAGADALGEAVTVVQPAWAAVRVAVAGR